MSKDGQEIVTWIGQGVGRFSSPGKIRFVGSLFFSTASIGKLAFCNQNNKNNGHMLSVRSGNFTLI